MSLEWTKLLCQDRRPSVASPAGGTAKSDPTEHRTEIERDHDRILFSTPVRRLADKTQVFPLERNDSVRTRLTHSNEVANLARSIGITLVHKSEIFKDVYDAARNVPAMLAAIGLAHDLGNPPFGHQGENAIRSWFREQFDKKDPVSSDFTKAMKEDLLQFEGNAQTIRLVTRLQVQKNGLGLNLTYGTLAALLKYPSPSDKITKNSQSRKKFGYFQSEVDILKEIWAKTDLIEGTRHPLTFIMEACDDIAYSVLDVEDAAKKGLISVPDLLDFLEHWPIQDPKAQKTHKAEYKVVLDRVRTKSQEDYKEYRKQHLSPSELNDISIQLFRVHAIGEMVSAVFDEFKKNIEKMLAGSYDGELITDSIAGGLCAALKFFARKHAYNHRSVLEVELRGYHVLRGLMDLFWVAISKCTHPNHDEKSTQEKDKPSPHDYYVYGRISENYRRVFEKSSHNLLYRQYQLLTDMVSGMTDSYAVDLYEELRSLNG